MPKPCRHHPKDRHQPHTPPPDIPPYHNQDWTHHTNTPRMGEAKKPGPEAQQTMLLECGNITHMATSRAVIHTREAHCFFGQEHSLPPKEHQHNRKLMKPWSSHFSQLDLEKEQHTGGICAHRKDGHTILTPTPTGQQLRQLNGKGRVQMYALALAPQITILIYNIYGWTGANHHKEAARRTSSILDAIMSDMQMQPPGPMLIMGDLNGDPATFPILTQQQEQGNLLDVGEQAQQWGQPKAAYTCKANNT